MKTCKKGLHRYDASRRQCPECKKATDAAWYQANPERAKASASAWVKANPERVKANYAAWRKAHPERAKANSAAWYQANPERAKANSAAWYQANPERAKAYFTAWRQANPEKVSEVQHRRRARKAANPGSEPVSRDHLALLFEAQDGHCRYCPTPLDAAVEPWRASTAKHIDHRVPISRGGPHAPHNVCWACSPCNLAKGARTEAEFLAARNTANPS